MMKDLQCSMRLEPTQEIELVEPITNSKESYLRENNVDLDKALQLLGDIEMYNMTISDFYQELPEKWQRIIDNKDNHNMKDYAIDVHSLKSDCKYLGFMKLADIAYLLNHKR